GALPVIFNRTAKDSLADDEIIISADNINNFDLSRDYYESQRDEIRQEIIQDFEDRGEELDEDYLEYAVEGEISNRVFRFSTYAYALSGRDDEFDAEYLQRAEREVKAVLEFCGDIETTLVYDYYGNAPTTYNVKIVGVFTSYGKLPNGDYYYSGCYFSENFIKNEIVFDGNGDINTRYEPTGEEIYAGIILPYDGTEETYNKLAAHLGKDNRNENDVYYVLNSFLYSTIQLANETADLLKTVFLWVGIVFAVFAALLMFNFISVSISNKRKEIGILRAVGARGVDVFKIFFSEAGIISGICTVLSLVGTFALCIVLNGVIKKSLGLGVSLFVFGFASVGIMLAIAVVTAFIATFLPVFLASRKKPVDSIRAL
ncbi:MAG: FtsX-like permease family protein, partial [Clostridia bacterium]|nr:FtsX-like permease family protein [Clostridia bacterium]